jgi:O-antigen ligase
MNAEIGLLSFSPSRRLCAAAALIWLALSAVVGWGAGAAYGLFLAWAGIIVGAFALNPPVAMAAILVVRVAGSDLGETFVLFPGTAYAINQAGVANFVMIALALAYVIWRRPKFGPLAWPFLGFLGIGLASIAFGESPAGGIRDWSRFVPLLGVYIIWSDLLRDSPRRARLLVWTLIAASVWPAIVAAYQFVANVGRYEKPDINRLFGTLHHPIIYGAFLGIVFVLLLVVLREAKTRRLQFVLACWGLLSLTLLFLTYSRGPSLAMVAALSLLAVLASGESRRFRMGVAALALAFLAATLLLGRTADLRAASAYVAPTPGSETVNSLAWRVGLWKFAMGLAAQHPILGLGLGSFPLHSPVVVGWEVTPHNDFVRVLVEMGILGLGAYLWLWVTLGFSLLRLRRRASDRNQALWAVALIAVAAVYLVNSLSADLLNAPVLGWLFWSLAALPAAFGSQRQDVQMAIGP